MTIENTLKIDMRDAFFDELVNRAYCDKRICVLTADHSAFSLKKMQRDIPNQIINVGISEQNMVGVAAGLAKRNKIPFIYGITPFVSLRVLEQLTIDIAAMNLPVGIISVGCGFTYSTDGPTHHGLQDVGAILTIPNMRILNSSDPVNTKAFVESVIEGKRPTYIRVEKEKVNQFNRENEKTFLKDGYSILKSKGWSREITISTGIITHKVKDIIERSKKKDSMGLIDMHELTRFTKHLGDILCMAEEINIVDEGYETGLASKICLELSKHERKRINIFCAEKRYFHESGNRDYMYEVSKILSNYENKINE